MQLNSETSKSEIRAALGQAAEETWGVERAKELGNNLDKTAAAVWIVLQYSLGVLDKELEEFGKLHELRREG